MRSLVLATALSAASAALAQPSAFPQDARPAVPLAEALAMGDAVTAVPMPQAAFFVNPAHLAALEAGRGVRLQVLGAGAGVGGNTLDLYRFYEDELGPALEEGLDEIRQSDYDRLDRLYARALDLGRRPSTAAATAFLPAVQLSLGPTTAVQAGVFTHSTARGQLTDGGAGVPLLDVYDQTDVIVPVGAALRVPGTPLAVGATASYTRRYVTGKYAFLDELNPDAEALYVLAGSAVTLDVGLLARDVGVRGLSLGLAVHRLVGGAFTYEYDRRIEVEGEGFADDEGEIAALEARFNGREARPQVRAGAAYRLAPAGGGAVRGLTLAADWVGSATADYEQSAAAKLRLGAALEVGRVLTLRGGLAQGYPALGAGLALPFVLVDYGFFGVEDGRTLGQLRRGSHHLALRLGMF